MDLLPTAEQQQIVDTAANVLASEFPVSDALQLAPGSSRFARDQLGALAQLGWLGIGLPEDVGGVGYGLCEEALLFAQLGRHLMPPSLLGSALGARAAILCGAEDEAAAILCGARRVITGTHTFDQPVTIGAAVSGEFLLFESQDADLALLADEAAVALLPMDQMQRLEDSPCLDPSLDCARWSAAGVAPLAWVKPAQDPLFLRGAVLTAAMQLGGAEATLERCVAYAKEREQYGKPIGAFQAIKHYCADMAIRCESVRSMLHHASITLGSGADAGAYDTHTVKALADETAQHNANTAVQVHGGMGFTQEMDIHLFVKRAQVLATLFGSQRYHLGRLLHAAAPMAN